MSTKVAAEMFAKVAEGGDTHTNKISIVGCGQVGMACAFSLLSQVN
jgi:hypothetical protein